MIAAIEAHENYGPQAKREKEVIQVERKEGRAESEREKFEVQWLH